MSVNFNKYNNREDGFTLIELLIVVLIIGILAAIAIPVYLGVQNQSHRAAVRADVNNSVKRVQVALTEGTPIATIKSNSAAYTQASEIGESVTVTDSASAPGTTQFGVTGIESTTGTPKGAIDYTYTYDSATGKFTEGAADINLGGGSTGTQSSIGAQPAFVPNTYTKMYTLATGGLDNANLGSYSTQLAPYGSTIYTPCYNTSYNPTKLCKITSNSLTVLAGNDTSAIVDGTGTAAGFGRIATLRVDAAGNVYLLDYANAAFTVRKYDPNTRAVTTIGTVTSPAPQYSNVADMSLAPDGNINILYDAKTTTKVAIVQLSASGTTTPLYTGSLGAVVNGFDIYTNAAGTTFIWNGGYIYKLTGLTTLTLLNNTKFNALSGDNMVGDNSGNLYFTASQESSTYSIYKMNQNTGAYTTLNTVSNGCGARNSAPVAVGAACTSSFGALALGTDGNLYFTDYGYSTPTGYWLRYIGS